jgi:hypothetical protein
MSIQAIIILTEQRGEGNEDTEAGRPNYYLGKDTLNGGNSPVSRMPELGHTILSFICLGAL